MIDTIVNFVKTLLVGASSIWEAFKAVKKLFKGDKNGKTT